MHLADLSNLVILASMSEQALWLTLWLAMIVAAYLAWKKYTSYLVGWNYLARLIRPGDFKLSLGARRYGLWVWQFTIPAECRPRHMYVVGASGFGKSALLQNLILQDIFAGMGPILIDPHGDLVRDICSRVGDQRDRVVLIDLEDEAHLQGYNPLARKEGIQIAEQVAKLILAFKRIWQDSWGARMEDILRHSLTLLVEQGYTLCEFERLLTDADFRELVLAKSEQWQAKDFFEYRFKQWNSKERSIFIESSLNKVSALVADPRIACRLGQADNSLDVSEMIRERKIVLVNLARGSLAGNADLFGALFMADLEMSFLSRPPAERFLVPVFVDEFQTVASESFSVLLAEARKFGLCFCLANQTLSQLDDKLVSLILGNVQTQIYFRVNRLDAERLSKEANNIVAQIKGQLSRSTRGRTRNGEQRELSLTEMWEIAVQQLTQLPLRECYVTVRGRVDEPQRLRTIDNPNWTAPGFEQPDDLLNLAQAMEVLRCRRVEIDEAALAFAKRGVVPKKQKPQPNLAVVSGRTLDFLPND